MMKLLLTPVCNQVVHSRGVTGRLLFSMQAAEIVFTNAAHPIDPLQVPLHGVLATGYAAAAHTFWTLKAICSALPFSAQSMSYFNPEYQ